MHGSFFTAGSRAILRVQAVKHREKPYLVDLDIQETTFRRNKLAVIINEAGDICASANQHSPCHGAVCVGTRGT
jgi:hypothetical protein